MVVKDFQSSYPKYENMSIWELKTLDEVFQAHEQMQEVFEKEFGFPASELQVRRATLKENDAQIVSKLLDHFGDKHFFIFSFGDAHHHELMHLQDKKIIHFGIDIHVIHPNRVYVLEMDKSQNLQVYDTI